MTASTGSVKGGGGQHVYTLTSSEVTVYAKVYTQEDPLSSKIDLTSLDLSGCYNSMANCQYTCEDLRPALLYKNLQYPHVGLFCICYRGSNIGFLAIYRDDRFLDLPPFCIQLGQAHDKRLLWKFECILFVNGYCQPAY